MNTATLENNQAEILGRAIDRQADELTPEIARFFTSLELTAEDERRMNDLAERARAGELTGSEQADLEEFRRCGRLIEMMKLKARKKLHVK